ncbi:MAG: hypothetical protein PHS07_02490 [Patescibacteria group bacterium]|jgi:hypothetical protein|nr:hypothetical protein [Patescibacteria group bacterium]
MQSQEDKKVLMWVGVGLVMLLIIFIWIFSFKHSASGLLSDEEKAIYEESKSKLDAEFEVFFKTLEEIGDETLDEADEAIQAEPKTEATEIQIDAIN